MLSKMKLGKKYQSKVQYIQAVEFTGDNFDILKEFANVKFNYQAGKEIYVAIDKARQQIRVGDFGLLMVKSK